MTPEKIVSVIEGYEARLSGLLVPKTRMDIDRTFRSLSIDEALAHAHYLCGGMKEYALNPSKQRKAGSHLTSVQICLSLGEWYTLRDLMNHNRPPE